MRSINNSIRPGELFGRRRLDHWRHQYRVVRSIVDLTILLYIVIPGLLIFGRFYYGMWQEGFPEWLMALPMPTLLSVIFILLTTICGLITYIDGADLLFLRQHPKWIRGLLLRGMGSSGVYLALVTAGVFGIFAPLFVRLYNLSGVEMLTLFIWTLCLRYFHLLIVHIIEVKFARWRKYILRYLVHTVTLSVYLICAAMGRTTPVIIIIGLFMILAGCVGLIQLRLRLKGTFFADVREDERMRTRLTALTLSQAIDKPRRNARNRPWIFRRSGHIMRSRDAAHRLAELSVKAYYRNGSGVRLYLMFSLIGAAALQLPPVPVMLIAYVGIVLLLAYWVNSYRLLFLTDKAMGLFPLSEDLAYLSYTPTMRMLLLPGMLLLTSGAGIRLAHAWWGGLAGAAGGCLLAWWLGAWIWQLFGGVKSLRSTLKRL